MEKYVQSYLSKNFEIRRSSVGNDGVYLIGDTSRYVKPVYSVKLINELVRLFVITEEDARLYVDNWGSNIRPDVDLEFYWLVTDKLPVMEAIRRILDEEPIETSFCMDYAYTASTTPNLK
jgi:hypothetical protein